MPLPASKSQRRPLRFWGWGYADEHLSPEEDKQLRTMLSMVAGDGRGEVSEPSVEDFALPAPRVTAPAALDAILSTTPYDRLVHAYGKSYPDGLRMVLRDVPSPPDLVAFPKSEGDVVDVLDWASDADVAVIPFGGGTSVCGGVESVCAGHAATLSLDLQHLDRVVEIDDVSRAARIQAGAFGPAIEDALRPQGLTLRHFPQSFQFSTLGGWIATRSGGHYATLYTHIDDFVESTRTVTPRGVMETRRLPGSGAGPSPDRMMIGSEGVLGVITEAWMRLQSRPTHRASASIAFNAMPEAVAAVRALSQSGLFPSNCRLLDPMEVMINRVGDGQRPTLIVGFESADHPVDGKLTRALELAADHGGEALPEKRSSAANDASGEWKNAFVRMPYYRNLMIRMGVIADTFESAITWDKFDAFYEGVRERVGVAAKEVTGKDALLSCRFTHVYPDGPAPYFSLITAGAPNDLQGTLSQWRAIKAAATEAVVSLGGTVTHHHAVGRDHRPGYDAQSPALFREALTAAKRALDPKGILNPGVLVD